MPQLSIDYLRRNKGNVEQNSFLCHDEYWSLLLALYLDVPLLEQCFVAVGWGVWDDHPVILALSPETFVQ